MYTILARKKLHEIKMENEELKRKLIKREKDYLLQNVGKQRQKNHPGLIKRNIRKLKSLISSQEINEVCDGVVY